MEINSVCISLEKYQNLIEENYDYKEQNKNLKEDLENKISIEIKYKNKFLEDLLKTEEYHLENLQEENSTTKKYHYNQLQEKFLEIGINDLNYIYDQIKNLLEMYKKQKESKN